MTVREMIIILDHLDDPEMEIVLPAKDKWIEITKEIEVTLYSDQGPTMLLISQKVNHGNRYPRGEDDHG